MTEIEETEERGAVETQDAPRKRLKFDVTDMILEVVGDDPTRRMHREFIKQQLATIDRVPTHPVYPVMIQDAIIHLNEGGGSTMEAISHFIATKYDVLRVVHPAKLMEQLHLLVEKNELVFTSEDRYLLPVENIGSLAKMNVGHEQQHELQRTGSNLCTIEEGNQIHDQNASVEAESKSESEELDGPPGFYIESSASGDPVQEDPIEVIEGQSAQEGQPIHAFTKMGEGSHNDEMKRIEGLQRENALQEKIKVSEENKIKITGRKHSQANDSQANLIEEEGFLQHMKSPDVQNVEEIQVLVTGEAVKNRDQSQLQQQALKIIENQVEAQCEFEVIEEMCHIVPPESKGIEAKTQPRVHASEVEVAEQRSHMNEQELKANASQVETPPQSQINKEFYHVDHAENKELNVKTQAPVQQNLHNKNRSQLEQMHDEGIETQVQEQEFDSEDQGTRKEVVTKNKHPRNISELIIKKPQDDETRIITPNSSSANPKLDHVIVLKDKYEHLLKMTKDTEQELREAIDYLGTVEASNNSASPQMLEEVPVIRESEPKASPFAVNVLTNLLQHLQNQQIELLNLIGTSEVELTALESFHQPEKPAKLQSCQDTPESQQKLTGIAPDLQLMDSEELELERTQDFSTSGDQLSEPLQLTSSPNELMEPQEFDLEQQSENPRKIVEDMPTLTKVCTGRPRQAELPRRLRTRAPNLGPPHPTFDNNLNVTIPSIKLQGKQKLGSPVHTEPQSRRPKEVVELCQLSHKAVNYRTFQRRRLRAQLKGNTLLDGVQMLENPAQIDPCTAKDVVQSQQPQPQPQQQQLQILDPSQPEQPADKAIALPLALQNHNKQQDHVRRGRGRPANLKPIVDMAKEIFSVSHDQIHDKKQDSQIKPQGRPPKNKNGAKLTIRQVSLDIHNHANERPEKCRRGRPPKDKTTAALTTRQLPSYNHNYSNERPQKRRRGRPSKDKTSTEPTMRQLCADHINQDNEQPGKHWQGRPPKSTLVTGQKVDLLPPQHPQGLDHGDPPEPELVLGTTIFALLPRKRDHVHQGRPSLQGRKTRYRAAATAGTASSSPLQQENYPFRGKERPDKRKIEAATATDNLSGLQCDPHQSKRRRMNS